MRTLVAAAVACLAFAGLSQAADVRASIRKNIEIPAQELSNALHKLSQERAIRVMFIGEDVEKHSTKGVTGTLSVEEVLSQLLQGTGLTYEFIDEETVSILPVNGKKVRRAGEVVSLNQSSGQNALDSSGEGMESQTENSDGSMRLAQVDERSGGNSGSSVSGNAESTTLEEIVVTAQKREEHLQDVPISISVLSGTDLDRFTGTSVNQALTAVPGLTIEQGGGLGNVTTISLRGVAAGFPLFGGSSAVAYYVDSVPFGLQRHAFAPDPNAFDLERVEVLRGPQGTLYGSSALNGVVRVLTHDANLNEFEVKTRVSAATVDQGSEDYRGDLAVNVPIVAGKLAVRGVVGYADEGGWIDRLNRSDANSGHQSNARLKINAQPTEQFSIGASAWLSRSRYGASTSSDGNYQFYGVLDQPQVGDFDAFGLKLGYESTHFSISSMTSYVDYSSEALLDATAYVPALPPEFAPFFFGAGYFTGLNSKILAEEILLTSAGTTAWRWSIGAFYRDAKDLTDQHGVFLPSPQFNESLSESGAVFGEVTHLFWGGKLELTGGLRYFEDHVRGGELIPSNGVPGTPLAIYREKFTDVSPRLALTWHPNKDLTLYTSYSEGFRSGISQNPAVLLVAPGYPPADPDSLKNYEIGAKGNSLGGRFGYDAAVYYVDWTDTQQTVAVPIGPGAQATYVNGESASGVGVDLALLTRLGKGWELSAGLNWNDLGFDQNSFNPATGVPLFRGGERLARSSKATAAIGLGYAFPLAGVGLEGKISAGANYRSRQSYRVALPDGVITATGDNVLIPRADFSVSAVDRWRAMLFVENLTNERDVLVLTDNPLVTSGSNYTRPRSIGLQLEYSFR